MAHEEFQEGELLRGEVDSLAGALHGCVAGSSVRSPRAGSPAAPWHATDQRLHAREEFGEVERLGEVVVRAQVKAPHAVIEGVAGGQHQDRRPRPGGAHLPADLEPVDVGQTHVEHDRVVRHRCGEADSLFGRGRAVDQEAFLPQAPIRSRAAAGHLPRPARASPTTSALDRRPVAASARLGAAVFICLSDWRAYRRADQGGTT